MKRVKTKEDLERITKLVRDEIADRIRANIEVLQKMSPEDYLGLEPDSLEEAVTDYVREEEKSGDGGLPNPEYAIDFIEDFFE